MIKKLIDWIDGWDKGAKLALAAALLALIYGFDQLVGVRLSLLTFFWVPVALATWYCGMTSGLLFAAVSIALAIHRDMLGGRHYGHPLFFAWDLLDRGVSFYFFVWVIAKLNAAYKREAETLRVSRETERLKSSMLSLMSHEIANAISVLKMSVFLAREHESSPSPMLQCTWDTIGRVLLNMDLAARNFLDNARMESGRLVLKLEPVDLGRLVDDIVAMFGPLFSQRRLTVILDEPRGATMVSADRAALSLIMSNLIGNAVKYTRDGGRVTIKLEDSKVQRASVRVIVADSGIGISAQGTKKIAAAFVRLPEGKLMAKGFGLGLKTVHDLLEMHGSHLQIDSEVGKGSRFSFTLPAAGRDMENC